MRLLLKVSLVRCPCREIGEKFGFKANYDSRFFVLIDQVVKHSDFSNYAIRFKRTNIPILGDTGHENHWAGYLDIGANEDPSDRAHLFFTFHESRRNAAVDPVTLWLSGGPGKIAFLPSLL